MGRVPRGERIADPRYQSLTPPPCLRGGGGENAVVRVVRSVELPLSRLRDHCAGWRSLVIDRRR